MFLLSRRLIAILFVTAIVQSLCSMEESKPIILLQAPQKLSQQEIDVIEQEGLKNGWEASFGMRGGGVSFCYRNGVVRIDIDETTNNREKAQIPLGEDLYLVHKLRNFKETPHENNPSTITEHELCELIKTKSVIFYTGAGISAAAGVWTMQQLMGALGFGPAEDFDQFIQNFKKDSEKIKLVFAQFCSKAFTAQPTSAHFALTSIALAKKSQILTENFDLLHEHTGIKAHSISGPWLRAHVNPDELKDVDVVVCVALSHDDRGFLGWYKEHNPGGVIVAIDLGKPSYLGNEDFFLKGDCQEFLPRLQQELSNLALK